MFLLSKGCGVLSLNCRYLNPRIKSELIELAILSIQLLNFSWPPNVSALWLRHEKKYRSKSSDNMVDLSEHLSALECFFFWEIFNKLKCLTNSLSFLQFLYRSSVSSVHACFLSEFLASKIAEISAILWAKDYPRFLPRSRWDLGWNFGLDKLALFVVAQLARLLRFCS